MQPQMLAWQESLPWSANEATAQGGPGKTWPAASGVWGSPQTYLQHSMCWNVCALDDVSCVPQHGTKWSA
eukprot:1146805-Pelagomonas_calceolata.AAC.10